MSELLQKANADKLEVAKRLLKKGLSTEDVADGTGLEFSIVRGLV